MEVDEALTTIAEYVSHSQIDSVTAFETARYCLADAMGCAMLSLNFKACTKLLGPIVPATIVPNGSRVPGTNYILDPLKAAFDIGTMIRWLDFNDTWLAAEWGHPSDNLGGLLALADYLSRSQKPMKIKDLLIAMVKAYEIQGVLALRNSFNRIGLDHVILVKVATAAVAAGMLGLSTEQIRDVVSHAWIDSGPLRTYRHKPNVGSRKSWAAGDATSRGIMLAMLVQKGEMGYPLALSAKQWGFYDVVLKGKPLEFAQPLGSYVMENILFKVAFPAEFHAQTAVEAGIKLHPAIKNRLSEVERIEIKTHEAAIRIIDKKGKLNNPADRDHCLQYMTAVALLYGDLKAKHYEDETAQDPRIDALRDKMTVKENKQFTMDYIDPDKRSIANTLQVFFKDGTKSDKVAVEYPLGHRNRRSEGIPLLLQKCRRNLSTRFPAEKVDHILTLLNDPQRLDALSVSEFIELFLVGH